MPLIALGVNHQTAPVEVREKVAVGEAQMAETLRQLQQVEGVEEAALVSTCNRTEIYARIDDGRVPAVVDWLARRNGLATDALADAGEEYDSSWTDVLSQQVPHYTRARGPLAHLLRSIAKRAPGDYTWRAQRGGVLSLVQETYTERTPSAPSEIAMASMRPSLSQSLTRSMAAAPPA